jgi:cytochrome c oxidase cbb3-type subunit 3
VIAYLRYLGTRDDLPILRTGVGNPRLGHQLYQGTCASCHGPMGEGASGPQLNNPTLLRSASDGFLAATIVLGRVGTAMQPMVHGHEGLGQIRPENVADVIAYLRLWDYPQSWRTTRQVPERTDRSIAVGGQMFAAFCAGCHGPNGRGVSDGSGYYAPALNNPEFLAAASDGFLLATIARGRSGTPMRGFGKGSGGIAALESSEINDIVSFLRSWQVEEEVTHTGGMGS